MAKLTGNRHFRRAVMKGGPAASTAVNRTGAQSLPTPKALIVSEGEGGFIVHAGMPADTVQADVPMFGDAGGAVIVANNGLFSIFQVQSAIDETVKELRELLDCGHGSAKDLMERLHAVVVNLCVMTDCGEAIIAPEMRPAYYSLSSHYWTIGEQINALAEAYFNNPDTNGDNKFPSGLVMFLLDSINHHYVVEQQVTD